MAEDIPSTHPPNDCRPSGGDAEPEKPKHEAEECKGEDLPHALGEQGEGTGSSESGRCAEQPDASRRTTTDVDESQEKKRPANGLSEDILIDLSQRGPVGPHDDDSKKTEHGNGDENKVRETRDENKVREPRDENKVREPANANENDVDESKAEDLPHAPLTDDDRDDVDTAGTSDVDDDGTQQADQLPHPDLPEEIFLPPVMRENIDNFTMEHYFEGMSQSQAEELPHAVYPGDDVHGWNREEETAERQSPDSKMDNDGDIAIPDVPAAGSDERGQPGDEPVDEGIDIKGAPSAGVPSNGQGGADGPDDMHAETDEARAKNEAMVDEITKQVADKIGFEPSCAHNEDTRQGQALPAESDYSKMTNDEMINAIAERVGRETGRRPRSDEGAPAGVERKNEEAPNYSEMTIDEIIDSIAERVSREAERQPRNDDTGPEGTGGGDVAKSDYSGMTIDETIDNISERVKEEIARNPRDTPPEPEATDGGEARPRRDEREPIGSQEAEKEVERPRPAQPDLDEDSCPIESETDEEDNTPAHRYPEGEVEASGNSEGGSAGSGDTKPADAGDDAGYDEYGERGGRSRVPDQEGRDDHRGHDDGSAGKDDRWERRPDEPEPDEKVPDDDQADRPGTNRGEEHRDTRKAHHQRDDESRPGCGEEHTDEARREENVNDDVGERRWRDVIYDDAVKETERYNKDKGTTGGPMLHDTVEEPETMLDEELVDSEEGDHETGSGDGEEIDEPGMSDAKEQPEDSRGDRDESMEDHDGDAGHPGVKRTGDDKRVDDSTQAMGNKNEIDEDAKVRIGSVFITESKRDDILARREQNVPIVTLAREIGVSPKTLANFLDEGKRPRFSKERFVDNAVKALEEKGPLNQGDLCAELGCGRRTIEKYLVSSDRVVMEKVDNGNVFRLPGQASGDLDTSHKERGVKQEVMIEADGSFCLDRVRHELDVRLAGMKFSVANRQKTMLLAPKGSVIGKLASSEAGLFKEKVNRDYGRVRSINSRGELKFDAHSHILGKELAGWKAEVFPLKNGIATRLENPSSKGMTRELVIIEKTENPTGLLTRKVDGNGSIWLKLHPEKEQESFYVGNAFSKRNVFVKIEKAQNELQMFAENNAQEKPIKICQIEKDPVDPSRRRVFSSGGIEYDNEPYFLGLEHAGNDVFVKPNLSEKQIEVYSDANKEQLLETFPIRASEYANPFLRTVSTNQLFSWNGSQVYARLSSPAEFVYVKPHPNEKELDLFSDENMTVHIGRATIGFDPDNPSFILDGIDRDAQMRFLAFSKEEVISFWRRRTSGEAIGKIAMDAGLAYEDMERIFKVNNIGVMKGNAADLQDFIQHYHPDAKIVSDFKGPCKPIEMKCEQGHYFEKLPVNIKDGAWCPDCYQAEHFKNEARCRDAVQRIFGSEFKKGYPPWLKSEAGGRLELDMYNERLKIAVEYNGRQHYEFSEYHHHKTMEDLYRQQRNDARKEQLCEAHGVTLIIVPYYVKPKDMESYIRHECERRGIRIGRDGSIDPDRAPASNLPKRL